ncbi:hypothetical protein ACVXZZ_14380 [Staphylococcus aureus]
MKLKCDSKCCNYKCIPILLVVILMMVSFYKEVKPRKFLGLTLTPNKHRLQDIKSQQEDYESDIT